MRAAFLAPAVEDGQAVDFGQAEVEHDRVVAFGRAQEMPLLAVGGEVDGIACALQRGAELLAQIGFVLDDQYAHCGSPLIAQRRPSVSPVRPST